MDRYAASIDIGGTKTLIGIVDEKGIIIMKKLMPTNIYDYKKHFENCITALYECLETANIELKDILGVGVNVPGMTDSEKGILIKAPFTGWTDVKVKDYFTRNLGNLSVYVENDVNSCAIGEMLFGLGSIYKNFMWITISTGIGGAVVVDGKLARGGNFCSGEIGHVKVEYSSPEICGCGQRGCLEAYASGTAITRKINELINMQPQYNTIFSKKKLCQDAAGGAVLAREGDATLLSIFECCGGYIGRALSHAINILNPEAIFLGGGVVKSLDLLLPSINRELSKGVIPQVQNVKILETKLGYEAALIGAAALVFYYEKVLD